MKLALAFVASLAIATAGPRESASAAEPLGSITEFSAGLTPDAGMIGIAAGPDGALWFPERNNPPEVPKIGRASTAGTITEFSNGLNPGSGPRLITAGPDGNMWFTDNGEPIPAIGRIGTTPVPSNSFSFGKLKRNKRRGTAELTVEVPGPGMLALSGKGLVQGSASAAGGSRAAAKVLIAASQVQVKVVSKGNKKRALNRNGKVKVKVNAKITYTPTGGSPKTQPKRIKLIKRG